MPGLIMLYGLSVVFEEQRLEELARMRADDDGMGQLCLPSPACRYVEALARSARETKLWLTVHVLEGWTLEQHRYWVVTGERP